MSSSLPSYSTRTTQSQRLPLLQTSSSSHFVLDDDDDDAEVTPTVSKPASPLPLPAHVDKPPLLARSSAGSTSAVPYRDEGEGGGDATAAGEEDELRSFSPLYGRNLRSTVQSREMEFDLDDGALSPTSSTSTLQANQSDGPLFVGLLSAGRRRELSFDLPNGGRAPARPEEDAGEMPEWLSKGGGMVSGIANMANSILGAGIIGLPYAVASAGFVTGITLLVVLCLVTDWTIRLIVLNAKLSGRNSYIEMMGHCFGEPGRAAVSFFQFAFAFGGMCAFGVIIGDTIPHVIAFLLPFLATTPVLSLLVNRSFVIFAATAGVSYPLSLHRDISKLSRASGIALVGMLIIVCSVLIEGSRIEDSLRGPVEARYTIIKPRVFEAIGVISFAFVCHHNSLLIYGSLQTPTLDRFAQVTHVSTAASLVACLAMALSGFLVFTDLTKANILNNFPQSDLLINIARLCFGLNMFTTLPLEAFVCREVIEDYFYHGKPFSQRRHVIVTTAVVFSTMVISLLTCDLGIVLELTGGLSATVLAFVFPAACYLRLGSSPPLSRDKLPAWACAAFGMIVMVLSAGLSLRKAFGEGGGERLVCS